MKQTNCGDCSAFKIARDLTNRKRVAADTFPATFEDIEMATKDEETKTGVPEIVRICREVLPREMFDKVMREFIGDAYEPFMGGASDEPGSEAEQVPEVAAADAAIDAITTRRLPSVFAHSPIEPRQRVSAADQRAIDAFKESIGDTRSIRALPH